MIIMTRIFRRQKLHQKKLKKIDLISRLHLIKKKLKVDYYDR